MPHSEQNFAPALFFAPHSVQNHAASSGRFAPHSEQNFPVFATGCWVQDSSIRTYVCDFRCTIEIGQVTIHDGDLVFGDVDGVLIVPRGIVEEVIEKALEKAAGEKLVRRAIEGGMSATDAFAKFGIL